MDLKKYFEQLSCKPVKGTACGLCRDTAADNDQHGEGPQGQVYTFHKGAISQTCPLLIG